MSHSVLIVEDDALLAENIRSYLERAQWDVTVCESAEEALQLLPARSPTVVLSDYCLPGANGHQLLLRLRKAGCDARFIMMTGNGEVQVAVAAMKAGAFDYLTKPLSLPAIRALLDRAIVASGDSPASPGEAQAATGLRDDESQSRLEAIIGQSPAMLELKATIRQVLDAERGMSARDLPVVLIQGETGTGKELVARALHYDGARREGPFVEINCASIPPHLLEAELFGYERGAFTDARERKIGVVEAADHGTLFLDEIGETGLPLQAKLLKLLEDKCVRRVGAVQETPVDLRIISATNSDLEEAVRNRSFRSDLFFRLRIISIRVPPLRARGTDILLLARHYLAMLGARYGKPELVMDKDAERSMLDYVWPGNVRELRNVIEQAVLLARSSTITPDQLQMCRGLTGDRQRRSTDQRPATPSLPKRNAQLTPDERELVLSALSQTGWNITEAARRLGLTRDMLRYRVEKLGLSRPE